MRYLARAIVIALLVSINLDGHALAQGPKGWWPFKSEEKETFVKPPTSLGAGGQSATTQTTSPSSTATITQGESASPKSATPTMPLPPEQTPTANLPHTARATINPNEQSSFLPSFEFPKFQMPYFPKPRMPRNPFAASGPALEDSRNNWMGTSPDPAKPSPWQAVTDGASRVGESTKSAWRKTVDIVTPGSPAEPAERTRVAQRDTEPSLWSRVFSPGAEKKEGPQTVTEWMGQERIKP
jgi:hypothetical protein